MRQEMRNPKSASGAGRAESQHSAASSPFAPRGSHGPAVRPRQGFISCR